MDRAAAKSGLVNTRLGMLWNDPLGFRSGAIVACFETAAMVAFFDDAGATWGIDGAG